MLNPAAPGAQFRLDDQHDVVGDRTAAKAEYEAKVEILSSVLARFSAADKKDLDLTNDWALPVVRQVARRAGNLALAPDAIKQHACMLATIMQMNINEFSIEEVNIFANDITIALDANRAQRDPQFGKQQLLAKLHAAIDGVLPEASKPWNPLADRFAGGYLHGTEHENPLDDDDVEPLN